MNQRDISEIKRRLNPDHRNPTVIRGCYLDARGQMISSFTQAVERMPEGENEKYMALFRRSLSGTQGQNLLQIGFTPDQTMNDENYALLQRLRESALKDDEAVDQLCAKIAASLAEENADLQSVSDSQNAANWLILLLHDGYDVPFKDHNGEIDRERSTDVFSYILCCVCPVRQTKPALSYVASSCEFHDREQDWVVSAPDLGFLFPAFEERAADVYSAVYYTKDSGNPHAGFISRVFNTAPFMPAAEQKEAFQAVLATSLADECSMDVLQAVHETVSGLMEKQSSDKTAEPLTLTRDDMREVLTDCGVSEEKAAAFEAQYDETFGRNTAIPAVNIVSPKQFRVETPSVSIKVDAEHSDLIETRVIDGKRYIMILADGDVEVNGMIVRIDEQENNERR